MHTFLQRRGHLLVISVFMLGVFLSGCALQKPGIAELPLWGQLSYQSVVLWRVRVFDKTSSAPRHATSRLRHDDHISRDEIEAKIFELIEKKDEGVRFDQIFMAQALPTNLTLYHIRLSTKIGTYEEWLGLDVDAVSWKVGPGVINYLGVIDVEITEEVIENGKVYYRYNYNLSQDSDDFKDTLEKFHQKYAGLYERFQNNIELANPYLFYEDFSNTYTTGLPLNRNSPCSSKRWPPEKGQNQDTYYSKDKTGRLTYTIKNKHDGSYTIVAKPTKALPDNFDIELETIWRSGDTNQAYGLAFGSSWDNSYRFHIAANGYAAIGLVIDKKYTQPEPMPWKSDPAIQKGDGNVSNVQRIEVRGNTFSYYVNGQLIGTIKNVMQTKEWQVGVTIEGKETVDFDRLIITGR